MLSEGTLSYGISAKSVRTLIHVKTRNTVFRYLAVVITHFYRLHFLQQESFVFGRSWCISGSVIAAPAFPAPDWTAEWKSDDGRITTYESLPATVLRR